MDPNATLRAIDQFLKEDDIQMATEAAQDLLGWIRKGGFSPNWDKYPAASMFVNVVS